MAVKAPDRQQSTLDNLHRDLLKIKQNPGRPAGKDTDFLS